MEVFILNGTSSSSYDLIMGFYEGGHCWRFTVDRNKFPLSYACCRDFGRVGISAVSGFWPIGISAVSILSLGEILVCWDFGSVGISKVSGFGL